MGRRRRLGTVGDDLQGGARGQLRLERDGRAAAGPRRRRSAGRRRSCRRSSLIPTPRPPRSPAATSITAGACPSWPGPTSMATISPASSGACGARADTVTWHKELARTPLHLVAFGESNDGELYLVDHDRTEQIYRLVPNPAAKACPRLPPPAEPDRPVRLDARPPAGPRSGPVRDQRRALGRRCDRRAVPGSPWSRPHRSR